MPVWRIPFSHRIISLTLALPDQPRARRKTRLGVLKNETKLRNERNSCAQQDKVQTFFTKTRAVRHLRAL